MSDEARARLARALFNPASIALIGASGDARKNTSRPQRFLRKHGYTGRIVPVNPGRTEIFGENAYPDLASVPERVDHAFIMVPAPAVAAAMDKYRVVSEKEAAFRALRASEERYGLAVRAANDGVWDWDLRQGHVYYSADWESMLGLPAGSVGGQTEEWFDRVHPGDVSHLQTVLQSHLAGEEPRLEVVPVETLSRALAEMF